MHRAINDYLEKMGMTHETESMEIDPYQTDIPERSITASVTVTKQVYLQMTDKEKINWIGIKADDFTGSIDRFKAKMEQIDITYESLAEMADAFMELYNISDSVPSYTEMDANPVKSTVHIKKKSIALTGLFCYTMVE